MDVLILNRYYYYYYYYYYCYYILYIRGSRARRKAFCDFENVDIDIEIQGAIM